MASISRFEDIEAWRAARELNQSLHALFRKPQLEMHWSLKNQTLRAAISIMANIAEGFGRDGNREFQHFLSIAKGSAVEVQSLLYIAGDVEPDLRQEVEEIRLLAVKTENLTAGFIRYLKQSPRKGRLYPESLSEDPHLQDDPDCLR
ncbi:MAG: four helix bundle protein [Opitutales bacterium]